MIPLLTMLVLASPLMADHLVGSWYGDDPDKGNIFLTLNADGTFDLSNIPSRATSDTFIDNTLQAFFSYTLADLIDNGMRSIVIGEIQMEGTFSATDDTITLDHPSGVVLNISGHLFNTSEFFSFLAASILAADGLTLSEERKEFLIFFTDTYMVEVALDQSDETAGLLTTTLEYSLSVNELTISNLIDEKAMTLQRVYIPETAVKATTWGEIKASREDNWSGR